MPEYDSALLPRPQKSPPNQGSRTTGRSASGSHHQPPGAWRSQTRMTAAVVNSLVQLCPNTSISRQPIQRGQPLFSLSLSFPSMNPPVFSVTPTAKMGKLVRPQFSAHEMICK